MAVTDNAKARRIAAEVQLAEHQKLLSGADARTKLLEAQLRAAQVDEARESSKRVHIERINELLEIARNALVEAGQLGENFGIDFTFDGPRDKLDFNTRWMSSDCYGTARWYDQGYKPGDYDNE